MSDMHESYEVKEIPGREPWCKDLQEVDHMWKSLQAVGRKRAFLDQVELLPPALEASRIEEVVCEDQEGDRPTKGFVALYNRDRQRSSFAPWFD